MSLKPFFSIILPTYNRASFIPKAIQSVIGQEFTDWELIIVDDGSTDNTRYIVSSFTEKRITYHWQENAERSAARNKGVGLAKGEYICFLDSDDWYLPNHLKTLHHAIQAEKNKKAVWISQITQMTDSGYQKLPAFHRQYKNDIDNVLVQPVMTSRICIHREVAIEFPFNPNIRIGEDRELLVRVAAQYPVYSIPEWTVVYADHHGRTVNVQAIHNHYATIQLVNRLTKDSDQISEHAKRFALASAWYNLGREYARLGKQLNCGLAFLRSSFYRPKYKLKRKVALLLGKG